MFKTPSSNYSQCTSETVKISHKCKRTLEKCVGALEACEMRLVGDNEGHFGGPAERAQSQESKRICRFCLSCCWLCGFLACWFVT